MSSSKTGVIKIRFKFNTNDVKVTEPTDATLRRRELQTIFGPNGIAEREEREREQREKLQYYHMLSRLSFGVQGR